jgi:phosphoesterase RecJ-like protein
MDKRKPMIWTDLAQACNAHSSFVISSHQGLDGDCVGCELALLWYCEYLGKTVTIVNQDIVPEKLAFLQNSSRLTTAAAGVPAAEVLISCDCSSLSRLGWDYTRVGAATVINIDHHRDNKIFGDYNYVDDSAAATAELVFNFFLSLKIDFPQWVAEALFAALYTDTGAFHFSNTTPATLRIAAELTARGASPDTVYKKIYASYSPQGVLLQARMWSTMAFHFNNRVCIMELPLGLVAELGANYGDTEGMADCTIIAAGVEVGMLIKYTDVKTHFSLRSGGRVDVGRIAQRLAGGGHGSAAGCTLELPLAEAKKAMFAILAEILN